MKNREHRFLTEKHPFINDAEMLQNMNMRWPLQWIFQILQRRKKIQR